MSEQPLRLPWKSRNKPSASLKVISYEALFEGKSRSLVSPIERRDLRGCFKSRIDDL